MKIVLFRHCERENTGTSNPPLSLRGQSQALGIVKAVRSNELPKPESLLCSPKLRAIQSFFPCVNAFSLSLSENQDLDERQNSENADLFSLRVKNYIQWLSQASKTTFVVSHMDWVEEAMIYIPCDSDLNKNEYRAWAPAQHMIFRIENGLWHLEKVSHIE